MTGEGKAVTLKGSVIEGFELWVTKDARQRTLWPSIVTFSQRYFEGLMRSFGASFGPCETQSMTVHC